MSLAFVPAAALTFRVVLGQYLYRVTRLGLAHDDPGLFLWRTSQVDAVVLEAQERWGALGQTLANAVKDERMRWSFVSLRSGNKKVNILFKLWTELGQHCCPLQKHKQKLNCLCLRINWPRKRPLFRAFHRQLKLALKTVIQFHLSCDDDRHQ